MPLCAEIALDYMALPPETIWEILRESHPQLLHSGKELDFYGDLLAAWDMPSAIRKKGKSHFYAKFTEGQLSYSPVGNPRISQILIENSIVDFSDSWSWVKPISQEKAFRAARVYDGEYDFWQNAHDLIQYEGSGRNYLGLPMKSNGLPYPLEKMIIDTSTNPGRRVFRQGYVEAVGAVMWLGDQFWGLTGARKQDVLAAKWLKCEQMPHQVLRVQANDAPFTIAEGPQEEIQNLMRARLFPCATPHNS